MICTNTVSGAYRRYGTAPLSHPELELIASTCSTQTNAIWMASGFDNIWAASGLNDVWAGSSLDDIWAGSNLDNVLPGSNVDAIWVGSNTDTTRFNLDLNSQRHILDLNFEPIIPAYKTWIDPRWIAAGFHLYLADVFASAPSTARRIEEAKAARQLIDEFGSLEENWDGYSASPISKQACDHARRFIDTIEAAPGGLSIPEVSPTPSGTISFEWDTPSAQAYLEIGDTIYSGFVKTDRATSLLHGHADRLDRQLVSCIELAICAITSPSATITEIHMQAPQYELLAA